MKMTRPGEVSMNVVQANSRVIPMRGPITDDTQNQVCDFSIDIQTGEDTSNAMLITMVHTRGIDTTTDTTANTTTDSTANTMTDTTSGTRTGTVTDTVVTAGLLSGWAGPGDMRAMLIGITNIAVALVAIG